MHCPVGGASTPAEDEDGPVEDAEGPLHLDREIDVTRRVNDVDLAIFPLAVGRSRLLRGEGGLGVCGREPDHIGSIHHAGL